MPSEDTQFKEGNNANPGGRPKSNRKWFDKIVNGRQETILNKAIYLALDGDKEMMKFISERYMPPIPKEDTVELDLSNKTYLEKAEAVIQAMSEEKITPNQAHTILAALATNVKIYESVEIINRIVALEKSMKK